MEVKDQIRMRMEALDMSYKELATRCDVTEQTCRFWTMGRNAPKKDRIQAVERALSFKIDFSEGKNQGPTVSENLEAGDIEMFLRLRKLPPTTRVVFEKMINEFLVLQHKAGELRRTEDMFGDAQPKTSSTKGRANKSPNSNLATTHNK